MCGKIFWDNPVKQNILFKIRQIFQEIFFSVCSFWGLIVFYFPLRFGAR